MEWNTYIVVVVFTSGEVFTEERNGPSSYQAVSLVTLRAVQRHGKEIASVTVTKK